MGEGDMPLGCSMTGMCAAVAGSGQWAVKTVLLGEE